VSLFPCGEQTLNLRIPLLLLLLLPGLAVAASLGETRATDSPTLRLHEKAEDLYRSGHWQRAYFIYVNELASIGDKYAQYMAGYMWLNGKGMASDPVKASAWYRLAAERGSPEFVEVRDQLLESMSESDREASDAAFLSLRQRYSDLVLALGHLRNERELLNERPTGSRLSVNSSAVTIIDPHSGVTITRSEYVGRLEAQMRLRLDFITRTLDIDEMEPDMSDREFEALAGKVGEYLQIVNDR
jgi:hypothetical protein